MLDATSLRRAKLYPYHIPQFSGVPYAIRETLSKFPLVPAVKWAVSLIHRDPFWRHLQPPLASLGEQQAKALESALPSLG